MFRTIIVDDERLARCELRALLDTIPDIEIVGEAGSVPEARTLFSRVHPDIAFLDVQLGRTTSFELVDGLPEECAIVFVTAYDQHAVRAFDVNALDYLLKPIELPRLHRAIARLIRGREPRAPLNQASPPARLHDADWLFLPDGDRRAFVRLRDVTHLQADGDYVVLHTSDGRSFRSSIPLTAWDQRLPRAFLRIHRRTIINLEFVVQVQPWSHYSYQISLRGVAVPMVMSRRFALRAREILG